VLSPGNIDGGVTFRRRNDLVALAMKEEKESFQKILIVINDENFFPLHITPHVLSASSGKTLVEMAE